MIRSSRVQLRRLERADAELYRRWGRSAQAQRFIYSPALDPGLLEEEFAQGLEGDKLLILTVETLRGQPVGYVSFAFMEDRSAELTILIGEPEWERLGYGVHALTLAIAFAFKELNLHRVLARYHEDNKNILAMARRIGGVDEGTLRKGVLSSAQPVDFHYVAFLQDEDNPQAQALSQRLLKLDLVQFEA
ncbi:MAG: GNAT family N-acetyltransferase [Acetobacteraceae bacterium]|nr:GNAT family N-acetyltransferase [Acetobacteraceae bacterium]